MRSLNTLAMTSIYAFIYVYWSMLFCGIRCLDLFGSRGQFRVFSLGPSWCCGANDEGCFFWLSLGVSEFLSGSRFQCLLDSRVCVWVGRCVLGVQDSVAASES